MEMKLVAGVYGSANLEHRFSVMLFGNYVAGYCTARTALDRTSVILCDVNVLPEYQNMGVATFMLGGVLQALREAGFSRVILAVGDENQIARKLYRNFGFTEIPCISGLIAMELSLV